MKKETVLQVVDRCSRTPIHQKGFETFSNPFDDACADTIAVTTCICKLFAHLLLQLICN
jgi:hypothetical protein